MNAWWFGADWQSAVRQVGNLRYGRLPIGGTKGGGFESLNRVQVAEFLENLKANDL
jgi:hypothetical protein